MQKKLLLNLFLILLLNSTYSKVFAYEAVLFGGGGDPDGDTTIFDESLKKFATAKSKLDLNLSVNFDGGHKITEQILGSELKAKNTEFTKKNFETTLKSYVDKIKSGAIKSGEQLLVMVDTHGGMHGDGNSETHSISLVGTPVRDLNHVRGDDSSSMDVFKELTTLAKEKNIKLGIIDFSCHSGNSIPLGNENTCVISASGPNHYAYNTFATRFYEQMKPGLSLEDVFLKAREGDDTPAFPMISTSIGKKLSDDMYSLFSPFLNYRNSATGIAADKLTPYLESLSNDANSCKRVSDYAKLISMVESFEKENGKIISRYIGQEDLVITLKEYKKIQDDLIQASVDSGRGYLNKKEPITYSTGLRDKKGRPIMKTEMITWKEMVTGYPSGNRDYFQELYNKEKSRVQKEEYKGIMDKMDKIAEIRKTILSKYPNIATVSGYVNSVVKGDLDLWNNASKVSELSNKMFLKKYHVQLEAEKKAEVRDPCRDFKL
jgi:hypothetical protein